MKSSDLLYAAILWMAASIMPVHAKTPDDVLVVAKNIDDIVSLDPAQAYEFTSGEIVVNVYDRLIDFDPVQSQIVPALAENWSFSEDGKTVTFKLREGAKFASGNPVRAEDVVFSFVRAIKLNKAPAALLTQLGWNADNVGDLVKQHSSTEVSFTIQDAFAPTFLLNLLSTRPGSIVDEQEVMRHEVDGDLGNAWLSQNSAGSGPFKLSVWRPREAVVLEANPHALNGAPKMRQIVFTHVAEPSTQRLMIESGDVDIARNLGPDQIAAVANSAGVRTENYPEATLHFFSLNIRHEKLNNPALWQAIRYLIDYEGITQNLLKGQMKVHQSFWPDGFPGAVNDTPYSLDIEKARQILRDGGVPDGLAINVNVISSSPFVDIAQALQSTMAQAGIALNIVPGTTAQIVTKYRAREHEGMLLYWAPDFMDPHSNAKSFAYNVDNSDGAPQSTTAWRNSWGVPELSAKTMAALAERDEATRTKMYEDLQREVMEAAPWAMTFQPQSQVAIRQGVNGYIHGPINNLIRYRDVTKAAE